MLNIFSKDEILRKESEFGVKLDTGFGVKSEKKETWLFLHEYIHLDRDNKSLWQDECKLAARNGTEPDYLKIISKVNKERIHKFIKLIEEDLINSPKIDWLKHAYSLLFTMRAYNNLAEETAGFAAKYAAVSAAVSATGPAAWDFAKSAGDAVRGAAWYAARYAAEDAAEYAARYAAEDAPAAWYAARYAARYATWDAAVSAARFAAKSEIKRLELTDSKEIGKAAYRVAEKSALLYFLKFAVSENGSDGIIEKAYKASLAQMLSAPSNNIFVSLEIWNNFKGKKFGHVKEDQIHFLKPWLDELDRIVRKIEQMED